MEPSLEERTVFCEDTILHKVVVPVAGVPSDLDRRGIKPGTMDGEEANRRVKPLFKRPIRQKVVIRDGTNWRGGLNEPRAAHHLTIG